MVKISDQFEFFYLCYCPETPQNGPSWVRNQKKQFYLPVKDENDKYPETETWKPETMDGECEKQRLCENCG